MKTKKILALCLVVTLCLGVVVFTACTPAQKDTTATTVMNVSLNPEVEFVLDADGNVVTVNAVNEEGNLIISASTFKNIEGKSAQEAVKLFVKVSADTGYIVEGNVSASDNNVSVSVSGDKAAADKIFADVKTAVEGYFSKEKITAQLTRAQDITRAQLEQLVAECEPYLQQAEIQAMEYKQLVAEIAASRKETAQYYSQEIKTAYYEAKSYALEQAKMEVLKEHLSELSQLAMDALIKTYNQAIETLEQVRYDNLVAETSPYQVALADFRAKKVEFLNFRNKVAQMEETAITPAINAQLDDLQSALDVAESALVSAGTTANAAIETAKAAIDATYVGMSAMLKSLDESSFVDEISAKQTEALDAFFADFEKDFASAQQSAKAGWNAMEENLKKGYQEN